ncbi:MAG: hypothetical protein JO349_02910 [Candidatus Eremiobacteraeota bacterium]|nr:hypothetical protein [Candidatus Eremiobacteraeota bacterium]
MDGLVFLRERIPAYADYGDEDSRHLVDKQVRAYVGEALSSLRERLSTDLAGAVAELLERTLLMCEFSNQQLIHMLDHAHLTNVEVEELHEVDHELITHADNAGAIELTALDNYLSELTGLFARRAQAVYWAEDRR